MRVTRRGNLAVFAPPPDLPGAKSHVVMHGYRFDTVGSLEVHAKDMLRAVLLDVASEHGIDLGPLQQEIAAAAVIAKARGKA